jgi:predicted RNA-binding Zn-ribbon protein involved in translation (DUF1610 family)
MAKNKRHFWHCPACGHQVSVGYGDLAEVGTPWCADCDREMVRGRKPKPEYCPEYNVTLVEDTDQHWNCPKCGRRYR